MGFLFWSCSLFPVISLDTRDVVRSKSDIHNRPFFCFRLMDQPKTVVRVGSGVVGGVHFILASDVGVDLVKLAGGHDRPCF